jgi:5-methylcytosine-specific restriction endonuclease McrA
MARATKAKQRQRAKFVYLEAICAVCGYHMWLDANAVAKGVRTCSAFSCAYELRRNTERYRDGMAIKNHRRRSAVADGEPVLKSRVWERDGGICHICKLPADPNGWHLEHIVPIARGGVHTYSNVAVSHPACNLAKGAKAA